MRPGLTVRTVSEEVALPKTAVLPDPRPIKTAKVNWRIVTPDTMPEGDFVFFALTAPDYEALSLNQSEALRWVTEAKHRLDYYRKQLGG